MLQEWNKNTAYWDYLDHFQNTTVYIPSGIPVSLFYLGNRIFFIDSQVTLTYCQTWELMA